MTMKSFILTILFVVLGLTATIPVRAEIEALPRTKAEMELSFAPLVKEISPAVVNIYTSRVVSQVAGNPFLDDPFFRQFFGERLSPGFGGGLSRRRVENALGSGVIVDADGLVVTNAHVIRGADEIKIVLSDGREFAAQKVLTDDPTDLALLRMDAEKEVFPFATLKPSESLEVGDLVLAIGNPFGVGQTVTSGIISALARSSLNISDFNFFIQTDAAINPGNSGGPLVAMDGSVVGINTAIYSRNGGSLGIGFAIPSEMVATVIAAGKDGRVAEYKNGVPRAWLGIAGQKITPDIAESLSLKTPMGVLIADLHSASPAKRAGLNVGDVVTAVNSRAVNDPAEMKFRMATVPLGSEAVFDVLNQGVARKITVKAILPPDEPPREQEQLDGYHPLNGVTVANVNPAVAVELGIREEQGVVIVSVDRRSPAMRFADPGDIIVSINGVAVTSVQDLKRVLGNIKTATWQIVLAADGHKRQIVIR